MDFKIIRISDMPLIKDCAADWFNQKWGIPREAYDESMSDALSGEGTVPQWYVALDGARIIGGAGVIENDFHDKRDLTPNVCALFVEPEYRCHGIAGQILDFICSDMKNHGLDTLYLLTDHTSFYERYGWQYLCEAQGDGEPDTSRMYIKKL